MKACFTFPLGDYRLVPIVTRRFPCSSSLPLSSLPSALASLLKACCPECLAEASAFDSSVLSQGCCHILLGDGSPLSVRVSDNVVLLLPHRLKGAVVCRICWTTVNISSQKEIGVFFNFFFYCWDANIGARWRLCISLSIMSSASHQSVRGRGAEVQMAFWVAQMVVE